MKRLIVYDLDGTLVDTAEDITSAVNFMLTHFHHPPLHRAEVLRYVGQGLQHLIKHCLAIDDPQEIERGINLYAAYYTDHLLDASALFPSAQALLDYFKDRKQAVITNKPNPYSCDILTGLGVADYFFEVIAGDSEYPNKPDPTAIRSLMAKHQINPKETLLIGDSLIDIQTGRNAGVFTAILTHGFSDASELASADPDVLVSHFEELMALARQHRW